MYHNGILPAPYNDMIRDYYSAASTGITPTGDNEADSADAKPNRSTLGQLAEQVQAKARADAKARGQNPAGGNSVIGQGMALFSLGVEDLSGNDEDDDGEYDGLLCQPGSEHTGRWTKNEHELFLDALKKYGKEWKKVAAMVKTRTVVQTRTHAQKYFQKLQKGGIEGDYDMTDIIDMPPLHNNLQTNYSLPQVAQMIAAHQLQHQHSSSQLLPYSSSITSQSKATTFSAGGATNMTSSSAGKRSRKSTGSETAATTNSNANSGNKSAAGGSQQSKKAKEAAAPGLLQQQSVYDEDPYYYYDDEDHWSALNNASANSPVKSSTTDPQMSQQLASSLYPKTPVSSGAGSISIVVPKNSSNSFGSSDYHFAQPSPAACGKRKEAELAAAQILAGSYSVSSVGASSSANKASSAYGAAGLDGAHMLSMIRSNNKSEERAKFRSGLSILNPEAISSFSLTPGSEPETPWETEVKQLQKAAEVETHTAPDDPSSFSGQNTIINSFSLSSSSLIDSAGKASSSSSNYPQTTNPDFRPSSVSIRDFLQRLTALIRKARSSEEVRDFLVMEKEKEREAYTKKEDENDAIEALARGPMSPPSKVPNSSSFISSSSSSSHRESSNEAEAESKDTTASNAVFTPLSTHSVPALGADGSILAVSVKTEGRGLSSSSSAGRTNSSSIVHIALSRITPEEGEDCLPLFVACDLKPDEVKQQVVLEICRLLVENGANVNAFDPRIGSCLHLAAKNGYETVGRFLLNKGCNVNQIDAVRGEAAVHVAARAGHAHFLELLADFGANCHIRNSSGRAALDLLGVDVIIAQEPNTINDDDDHQSSGVGGEGMNSSEQLRLELRRVMFAVEPRLRTLILYHEDCLEHTPRRNTDWEGPDRLQAIMRKIQASSCFLEREVEVSSHFERAPVELLSRVHDPEYISFVHSLSKELNGSEIDENGLNLHKKAGAPVAFTPQVQRAMLKQPFEEIKSAEYCDTTFSAGTLRAARRAAGAVAHAVDCTLLGRNRNAFCVVRPPGHHAGYKGLLSGGRSCGFCIFNSVAAGALHALEAHNCERVAIVDLDIHHGNGTEDIVRRYKHPSRLFFFSIHLFEKDSTFEFFPGTGHTNDTMHNIVNVPLIPLWKNECSPIGAFQQHNQRQPASSSSSSFSSTSSEEVTESAEVASSSSLESSSSQQPNPSADKSSSNASSGDAQAGLVLGRESYRRAITERLLPTLRAFNPSLIILSTGFDPAYGDVGNLKNGANNQTGMDMRPEDFAWVTAEIVKVADICCSGRVVSVLEGGYGSYGVPQRATRAKVAKGDAGLETSTSALNRGVLASSAMAHVQRLVDPYGNLTIDS